MLRFVFPPLVTVVLFVAAFSAVGCGSEEPGNDAAAVARPSVVKPKLDVSTVSVAPASNLVPSSRIEFPERAEPGAIEPSVVEPRTPEFPSVGGLQIKRLVFASGVEKREPVGEATSFVQADGPIYAFLEMENSGNGASRIHVEWQPLSGAGAPRGTVDLDVGASPRWRTWALTRTLKVGDWLCVVTDADGNELGTGTVHIE